MINKIKDLEKYYMQEITKVVESIDFQNDLKKLEEYIIVNYDTLREHSSEENKIKVGAERLIRYYFYTYFKVIGIYPSPISSDMAVELKDVILNMDAKTINMITNGGDDNSIHFQKNQITFDNIYTSSYPSDLDSCTNGDQLRLICMGKGVLMPDTRTLEDCDVPVFKTHPTPINVAVRPKAKVVENSKSGGKDGSGARGGSSPGGGGSAGRSTEETGQGCGCVIS